MKDTLKNYLIKTLTILLVIISIDTQAQVYGIEWERVYGGTAIDLPSSIENTLDGGFIMIGKSRSSDIDVSNNLGSDDVWIVKLDSIGNIEWEKNYGTTTSDEGLFIKQTSDGGYVFCGAKPVVGSYSDYWIVKIDAIGNFLWEKTYGSTLNDLPTGFDLTHDGGMIISGNVSIIGADVSNIYGGSDAWILKLDSTGNLQWEKNYGGTSTDNAFSLKSTNDGGCIIGGNSRSTDFDVSNNIGNDDFWVFKIDSLGTIEWEKSYGGTSNEKVSSLEITNDGGYIIGGDIYSNDVDVSENYGGPDFWVIKIDSIGNLEWENNFGGSTIDFLISIKQKNNGNYIISGSTASDDFTVLNNYGSRDVLLIEIDNLGSLVWSKNLGGSDWEDNYSLTLDSEDNIILLNSTRSEDFDLIGITGQYGPQGVGSRLFWVVKLKQLIGLISGNVYLDNNENCIYDGGDTTVPNVIVQSQNIGASNSYFSNTDNLGSFAIVTDTVTQNVTVINPSPYFHISSCAQDTQNVNLNSSNQTGVIDFFLSPTVLCPYMEVDISTPLLRRCFSNNYYVSYCNNGSQIANNAYVEVEFDPTLIIDSSSIPWTTVVGNVYTFPIGNIDVFDCGNFSISVSVPCDSTTFLGQVICAETQIYPDSFCLSSTNTWNGAELKATAECDGFGNVDFTLKNIGLGNMSSDIPVIVIEDVILVTDTDITLSSGSQISWKFPTNGIATHRIIARQPSDHPIKTYTTDAVANCNLLASSNAAPIINDEFLAYPNDEESPFEAVDCQPIIGSYDPNDKTVYPSGVSSSHYISETTDLEYKIRFQNTGTDTAYTVVIRDSISSLLDLNTFTAGASSHSYTYNIYGTGVVDFTFNNILLPDSFVNEPASKGFVQYKIEQKSTNQTGDIIYNNADIFFDYNLPVRTNTTFNEIGGIFLDTIIYKAPVVFTPNDVLDLYKYEVKVYPNPAKNNLYFEFNEVHKDLSIELYNLTGKMQQKTVGVNTNKLEIKRGNQVSGMYIFKIYSAGNEIAFGKLIFE